MQLTLYMLRRDLDSAFWGLRESAAEYREVRTRQIGDLDLRLLVHQSDPRPPRWMRDLQSVVEGDALPMSALRNSHGAALLLIRYRGHRFILAYGTGRFAIERSYTEPRFGLHVVANSVSSDRVISADTRGLVGRGRSQRTVMPSAGPLYELGIETDEELVRLLEGKPAADFANAAAGGESLQLKIRGFSLARLQEKLDQIIELYESSRYKESYEFLDYFTPVRREDKALRDALDGATIDLIHQRSDDLAFAPPDILEPLQVNHYVLRCGGYSSDELDELSADAVYDTLEQWSIEDPLRSVKVDAYDSSGDRVVESYSLLHYIVADIPYDDRRYVLAAGVWIEVDQDYVTAVQRRIDRLPDITRKLRLATWNLNVQENEEAYNHHVGRKRRWKVLDRKNFPIERPNQKVEVCDLLTPDKQLLCVKRMTKSSTLSHLFAQGLVSADLLVNNADGYQDQVIEYLTELRLGATFGSREDWTVVYAIATSNTARLSKSLYFFSKVGLDRTAKQLRSLGVNVALARVPLIAKRPT
jgi:uncharacterized protein (TIGR04141 family)